MLILKGYVFNNTKFDNIAIFILRLKDESGKNLHDLAMWYIFKTKHITILHGVV